MIDVVQKMMDFGIIEAQTITLYFDGYETTLVNANATTPPDTVHTGWLPQSVTKQGGWMLKGIQDLASRAIEDGNQLFADALPMGFSSTSFPDYIMDSMTVLQRQNANQNGAYFTFRMGLHGAAIKKWPSNASNGNTGMEHQQKRFLPVEWMLPDEPMVDNARHYGWKINRKEAWPIVTIPDSIDAADVEFQKRLVSYYEEEYDRFVQNGNKFTTDTGNFDTNEK